MKKTLLLLISLWVVAQGISADDAASSIPIAIVVPRQAEPLNESHIQRFENKMLDMVTKSGISAVGNSPIAMMPSFTIDSEDVVEGGMKNVVVISANITFYIRNLETNEVYSSISRQVRGSGVSRERAVNDCITKVSVSKNEFADFVERGRAKILSYYISNCSALMARAETFAKTQQYEQAIAVVSSIPSTATCYNQSLALLEKFYPAYQKQNCNELLQKARSLYGGHIYLDALAVLYDLKVFGTDCNKEVVELITTIEDRLSEDEERRWSLLREELNNRTTLHIKRLEAIQSIAVAYYGRTVFQNYNYIIR